MTPREQLERFLHRADELAGTRVVRAHFPTSLGLSFSASGGTRVSLGQPDEEDLRSFLLTLRQFLSSDEPVFLFRIFNLCQQHITDPEMKRDLAEARGQWAASVKSDGISMTFDGKPITPEYVTDLWINGHYFHNDEGKARALREMAPLETLLSRQKFLGHLIAATQNVLYVANVLRAAMREGLLA